MGIVINEGYGLTETSPFASYNHIEKYKLGSIGTPVTDVEMKIVDPESGREARLGELGEIVIRGPNIMLGYWNQPEETDQTIRNGWLHSGDIGSMDEEGYFYIVDRLKDMVNVAGMKVYPAEVENVIYRHPAIAEVAVYGVPDAITGEQVEAALILRERQAVSDGEILALCRQQLANFKVPARVRFVESLPKNPTGKILKRVLRQQEGG
jgi:long-chain acyl-CoA synthetase